MVGAGSILAVGGLDLDKVQLSAGNVALGTLTARDLVADLQRNVNGEWRFARTDKTDADETGTTSAEQSARAISIEAITITGDSAITIHDASVEPAFNTRLTIVAAGIGRIDSASPATDTPVTLKARTGKHSRIAINGTVQPFADRPTLQLESNLEGVSLTEVSSYTVTALGYALKSGQLDADSSVQINQGKVDINNQLTIRGLQVTPVDNASREQLDKEIAVSLETALNMLRDRHNTIRLELPVSGDINSPDFDISNAVNTAVSKALKKGAMTYLTLALQPYGALISVAKIAGEAAARVRLGPVVFDAGTESLRPDSGDYLEKVAGIMQDRPELNIRICGVVNEQDRVALYGPAAVSATAGGRLPDTVLEPEADKPVAGVLPSGAVAIDEQLLELAGKRATAVTDYLVSKHAITASRLVACQPAIDVEQGSEGRVDLLI
jgi:outer membrane protein OmpA-like peptidoglycan-associated protein